MKTRFLIIIPIIAGIVISLSFISGIIFTEKYYPTEIEMRIIDSMEDVSISSNMDVYSIDVSDEEQSLVLKVSPNPDGYIDMSDPLPILQKLFPDKNIESFVVLADGLEIPYTLENGRLGLIVNNIQKILIVGFSAI